MPKQIKDLIYCFKLCLINLLQEFSINIATQLRKLIEIDFHQLKKIQIEQGKSEEQIRTIFLQIFNKQSSYGATLFPNNQQQLKLCETVVSQNKLKMSEQYAKHIYRDIFQKIFCIRSKFKDILESQDSSQHIQKTVQIYLTLKMNIHQQIIEDLIHINHETKMQECLEPLMENIIRQLYFEEFHQFVQTLSKKKNNNKPPQYSDIKVYNLNKSFTSNQKKEYMQFKLNLVLDIIKNIQIQEKPKRTLKKGHQSIIKQQSQFRLNKNNDKSTPPTNSLYKSSSIQKSSEHSKQIISNKSIRQTKQKNQQKIIFRKYKTLYKSCKFLRFINFINIFEVSENSQELEGENEEFMVLLGVDGKQSKHLQYHLQAEDFNLHTKAFTSIQSIINNLTYDCFVKVVFKLCQAVVEANNLGIQIYQFTEKETLQINYNQIRQYLTPLARIFCSVQKQSQQFYNVFLNNLKKQEERYLARDSLNLAVKETKNIIQKHNYKNQIQRQNKQKQKSYHYSDSQGQNKDQKQKKQRFFLVKDIYPTIYSEIVDKKRKDSAEGFYMVEKNYRFRRDVTKLARILLILACKCAKDTELYSNIHKNIIQFHQFTKYTNVQEYRSFFIQDIIKKYQEQLFSKYIETKQITIAQSESFLQGLMEMINPFIDERYSSKQAFELMTCIFSRHYLSRKDELNLKASMNNQNASWNQNQRLNLENYMGVESNDESYIALSYAIDNQKYFGQS